MYKLALCLTALTAAAAHAQPLHGHVPRAVLSSRSVGRVHPATRMDLAIGLPLRNQEQLEELLAQLADPASPNYRQYMSAEQFAARFGPSEEDYQALADYLRARGFAVTATHPNRVLLDVSAPVAAIEQTFHVNMHHWRHATRGTYFAPDREPSFDAGVKMLDISGLDNFTIPTPMNLNQTPLSQAVPYTTGSGPSGLFLGRDFRAAYAPGVTLNGSGQTVGLLEFDGFYAADAVANFNGAGMNAVPVQTVLLDNFSGAPGDSNVEVILDIVMAAYMAPGLSKIMVYEGRNANNILNRMATDNLAKQLSSSWGFSPTNATTENIFKQMIAQGQSLFQASGDSGAYHGWIMPPSDDPYVTVVGGTSLTTSSAGGAWRSETAWGGSGGGASTVWPLPAWQQSVNMKAIGGSATMRNIPDVALTADMQMFLICDNGRSVRVGGTSAAAPLWAGFLALANQQAAAQGKAPVGFLNPLIYAIGAGSGGKSDLHDIATGSNGFGAAAGYDLATGWGTPAGQSLIEHLAGGAAASFGLSVSVTKVTLQPGARGSATITVSPHNGFSGAVSLSVSGQPAGVTASFSPASATTASTLALAASATVAAGTSTVTITGTSGSLRSTATLSLTVLQPGYSLAASPASLSVAPGASQTSTVTITPENGFSGTVALSGAGLPSGVTVTYSAASTTRTSTLTFTAAKSAPAGTSNVTITGVSGGISNKTTIAITVPLPPGFSLTASPASFNLRAGSKITSTIGINGERGFSGTVALAVSGLPPGVTAALSAGATTSVSTLGLTAATSATPGTATITISGVSGTVSAKTTLAVTVLPPSSFSLVTSAPSLNVVQGASGTTTITVKTENGFSGAVALSVAGLPSGVTAALSLASTTSGSTLKLTAAPGASVGSSAVTVTGQSGGLTSKVTVALAVARKPS